MADEDKSTDYSKFPSALREIYESLETELVWIHGRWNMYRQLFGTNERRVELLNESAPAFFYQLGFLWLDYTVLEICKITDRPHTNGNQNLVISQLHRRLVRSHHPDLADRLDDLGTVVTNTCVPLRERRNKRVAHSDLQIAVNSNTAIRLVSRQAVEDALEAVRNYVNTFRRYFTGSEMYFQGFELRGDAAYLLHNLKRASEYRRLEDSDHEFRRHIREGQWHDA